MTTINPKAYIWTMDVPSGKIVYNDWIHGLPSKSLESNDHVDTLKLTEYYSKIRVSHGFCGNSCPGIYQRGKANTYEIANYITQEDKDADPEYNFDAHYFTKPKNANSVGGIVTDLWWYTLVDYDRLKEIVDKPKECGKILEVPKGTYLFESTYPDDELFPKSLYCKFRLLARPLDVKEKVIIQQVNRANMAEMAVRDKEREKRIRERNDPTRKLWIELYKEKKITEKMFDNWAENYGLNRTAVSSIKEKFWKE